MQTLFSAVFSAAGCVPGEESAHWVSTRQGRHMQGPVALCSRLQTPAVTPQIKLPRVVPGIHRFSLHSPFLTVVGWSTQAAVAFMMPSLSHQSWRVCSSLLLCPVIFICQHCILAPHARFFLCYISFPNHYGCHPQGIKIEHKLRGGGKRGPSRVNTLQSRINSGSCGGVCVGWEA